MRKLKKDDKDYKKIVANRIVGLLVFAFIFSFSIGYALYTQILSLNGTVALKTQGDFYIYSVSLIDSSNVDTTQTPTHTDDTVDFNLVFTNAGLNADYTAVYEIVVNNDTFYDQTFNGFGFVPTIYNTDGEIISSDNFTISLSGCDDYIFHKITSTTLTVTFHYIPAEESSTYVVDGEGEIDSNEKPEGTLVGTVTPTSGDLTGTNDLAQFTISALNTYEINREFSLELNNPNFEICDSSGNTGITFNIGANTEDTFTFYIKKKDGATFSGTSFVVSVTMVSPNIPRANAGTVTLAVDETPLFIDEFPPIISNVQAVINNTNGQIDVTWGSSDDSNINSYTVIVYRNNTELTRYNATNQNYLVTGLSEGNYYFKVFGTDEHGNTASTTDINNATENSGYCSSSNTVEGKWIFNVTYNLTNLSATNTTVNRGATFTGTINSTTQGNTTYNVPENLTSVTMGGTTLSTDSYTYTRNTNARTGTITIQNVTGDIVITASGASSGLCLVEGTPILLANGKTKNIENITYDDLLLVFDHTKGTTTEVYPIWLEKKQINKKYTKVTLEDNTIIKFAKNHTIYNADSNMYASILNREELKVGDHVYKLKNNKLVKVKVKNIETINEKANSYNIVSTVHYNVFANNILTSDATAAISNIYGFKSDATYSDNYYAISNSEGLPYEKVNMIPKYLYYGLNLRNASFALNKDLEVDIYDIFDNYINDDNVMKSMPTKNGKILFNVNIDNKITKVTEGTKYKLPNNSRVRYYIETSTNKKYKPGSSIEVNYSIYLKSIKK